MFVKKNELYVLDDKNTLIFPEDDTDKQNDTYVFFMFRTCMVFHIADATKMKR